MTATQNPAPSRSAALPAPKATPVRRRWGRVAVGAVLALVGGLVSAQLYLAAGDRVEVVVLADDVDRFSEISADDLTTARVAADPTVDMISATSLEALEGRVAAYDLVAGSLLTSDHLHPEDELLVEDDQSVVQLEFPGGQVPDELITPGTEIRLVLDGGNNGDNRDVPAWVLEVGHEGSDHGRTQSLLVVVSRRSAPEVAAAARNGRIAPPVVDGTA